MTQSRIDYFRFTIKPEHYLPNDRDYRGKTPFEHCLSTLKNTLLLGELFGKLVDCGRCMHYDRRLSYENISIKLPKASDYSTQGICLEFSSQGLDYFNGYLDSFGFTFKGWCGMLRALIFRGYSISITRLDFAMDDIVYSGGRAVLSMRKIVKSIEDGELCCRARVWSDQGADFSRLFSYKLSRKRSKGEDLRGLTIQLGSRNSEVFCRFYDKYTEQKMKGNELPDDRAAWTRCEYVYTGGAAMSVFNAFLDYDDQGFADYMTGSALDFLRFVDRTSSNVTRCVTKRWWKSFLNGASKAVKFKKVHVAKSAFVRFSRGFKKQYLRKLFTVIDTWGMDSVVDWLERSVNDALGIGKIMIDKELQQNLLDGDRTYIDHLSGYDRIANTSSISDDEGELTKLIKEQHVDYYQQYYNVVRLGKRPNPKFDNDCVGGIR